MQIKTSVRPSVCHTRASWLIQRTYRRYFYTTWKGNPSSQMWFFIQLCSSWQDFNWLKASRGPSAIAELLVSSSKRKDDNLFCQFLLCSSTKSADICTTTPISVMIHSLQFIRTQVHNCTVNWYTQHEQHSGTQDLASEVAAVRWLR